MSGIAGIYNLDNKSADPALLRRMIDRMAHRGPDGQGCWIEGPVGLGHAMLQTTPESLQEKQPLSHERGSLCLTFDGRVDNRSDVRAALASKGLVCRTDTDAELLLRAYECWGEDCPQHILGDFAFAVWDGLNRKLFCARDPLGIRPFYYIFTGSAFTFSSELRPLLDTPNFQRKPNLGMLGEYLSDNVTSLDETLYRDILRLPPAHQLVLQDGALRITQYFQIDPGKTIRYGSDEEYAEHFFDIFKEAVHCRLRSQTPVSLFLSGGLDSSSIFGMAQRLMREGMCETGKLEAYSLTFSHPEADERTYVNDVARMWGSTVHTASVDDSTADPLVDQIQRFQDFPDSPNASPWQLLFKMARQNGSRVTLWGFGGDECLTGGRAHCADLFRQLQIPTLLRQIRHDVTVSNLWGGGTITFRDAVRWCLFPLIPYSLKSRIKSHIQWDVPRWITPSFARTIGLQDRLLRRASPPPFPTKAQQEIHGSLVSGRCALEYELVNRLEAYEAMEGRYPFCDRRLIEFALALPEEQRWRDDQTKYVLRQAMRRLLPDSVRQRKSKADFSYLYKEAVARESAGEVFQSLRLAAEGYIDAVAAREVYNRCMQGDVRTLGPVWMILALEHWLRTVCIGIA